MPYTHTASGSALATSPNNAVVNTVSATIASSSRIFDHNTDHAEHERLFIGPMPFIAAETKLKNPSSKKHWWLGQHDVTSSDNDMHEEVPERHAFLYFLRQGGMEQDWESQESLRKRVKLDILHHWRQSGWEDLKPRNGEFRRRKWVGTTFKIGDDFLGIPMHTDAEAESSDQLSQLVVSVSTSKTLSTQTYHTAPEGPSGTRSSDSSPSSSPNIPGSNGNGSNVALLSASESSIPQKATSLPGLLATTSRPPRPHTDVQAFHAGVPVASEHNISTSGTSVPVRSALHRLREGGSKTVQFSAVPQSQIKPVSPSEVLARRPSNAPDTSAAAAATQIPNRGDNDQGEALNYGDVVRQARMLVRRSIVKSGNVSTYFDAEEAMKLRDLRSYEWKEFLVVWRKEQLELYEDYSIPGKEKLLGHKHMACVIPLQKPDTRLSLYSFVDFTFCLTCTMIHVPKDTLRKATGLSARMLFQKSMGTDVFVFKTKTRTSGIDWMWELWRQLGNDIPQTFEVHCPALQSRLKLNIPQYDMFDGEGYKVFTKDYVVSLCQKALGGSPAWDYNIKEPMRRGARLQLCWRKGTMLDWIRWEEDANNMKRGWAVLYGLSLGKPREITHLEVRLGEHRPATVTLEDGTHLREPPAVEGYVYRIKPNSQSRTQVYLSTHGGCLFSISPSRAYPPRPPIPMTDDRTQPEDNVDEVGKRSPGSFKDEEIQRGAQQVLQAEAFIDLRNVSIVRQAFRHIFRPFHHSQNGGNPPSPPASSVRHAEDEDEGGEEALARHPDKPSLRMRRSFELLMKTGHVLRFETYSCNVAQEWIKHLRQLINYWTLRHHADASHEMKVIRTISGNEGLTVMRPCEHIAPARPPDYDEASEYLPAFWNWCVVEGCLTVVRNGRLFLRRSLRGQYRLMQIMLVFGHLVQFQITSHQTSQHVRSQVISLSDAYVCSGHYATQSLPVDEFAASREPLCRRFQDGLETEDHELDTVFLLWYRPRAIGDMVGNTSNHAVLPLKAKRRVIVLKARSKLERDAWCWALNTEIERLSRRTK